MIARFIYRILVRLHPRNFREQYGDEMLCIFDESEARQHGHLFADASLSLLRQWSFHSGWWKFLAGAAVSGVLVLAMGYSISNALKLPLRWAEHRDDLYALISPPPNFSVNEAEFEREAQEAVRMLAQYRREDQSRPNHRAIPGANRHPAAPARPGDASPK